MGYASLGKTHPGWRTEVKGQIRSGRALKPVRCFSPSEQWPESELISAAPEFA